VACTEHSPLSRSAAPIKRTAVEKQVNTQIVFLFILLLALSLGSTIGASIRSVRVGFVVALFVGINQCCLVGFLYEAMVSYGE
jgi:hypothetical protein